MNGGTFDQWAGDVTSFPVEIRNLNEDMLALQRVLEAKPNA
jgi:hypothetical protein